MTSQDSTDGLGYGRPARPGTRATGERSFALADAPPPRRRRGVIASIVTTAVVTLTLGGGVAAELLARGRLESELLDRSGAEAAFPNRTGGGFQGRAGQAPTLVQQASGRAERLELRGRELSVDGRPLSVELVAEGMPADLDGPAERVEVALLMPAEAVTGRLAAEGGQELYGRPETSIGGDRIDFRYRLSGEVEVRVELELRVEDGSFVVAAPASTMVADGQRVDLGAREPHPIELCPQLPEVRVEALESTVTSEGVRLRWQASGDGLVVERFGELMACMHG
ncbi:MAG: LmeA family phospholipid-binding protein [Pseudoclavibacter sp.]|nr:LmeA family phospholipid-binding protein [Pseudoclavibacter sp.]